MATWITDAELKQRLADILSQDVADVEPKWDTIISDSNRAASDDVAGRLLARGYTLAQVETWDRVEEFTKDIGLYWCLSKGGALGNYSDTFVKSIDRRKDLDTVNVLINGVPIVAGEPSAGLLVVGSGRIGEKIRKRLKKIDWFD